MWPYSNIPDFLKASREYRQKSSENLWTKSGELFNGPVVSLNSLSVFPVWVPTVWSPGAAENFNKISGTYLFWQNSRAPRTQHWTRGTELQSSPLWPASAVKNQRFWIWIKWKPHKKCKIFKKSLDEIFFLSHNSPECIAVQCQAAAARHLVDPLFTQKLQLQSMDNLHNVRVKISSDKNR